MTNNKVVTLEEIQEAYELVKLNTTDTYTAKEYAGLVVACRLSAGHKTRLDATETQKEAVALFNAAYVDYYARLSEIVDENNRSRGVQDDQ